MSFPQFKDSGLRFVQKWFAECGQLVLRHRLLASLLMRRPAAWGLKALKHPRNHLLLTVSYSPSRPLNLMASCRNYLIIAGGDCARHEDAEAAQAPATRVRSLATAQLTLQAAGSYD